MHQYNGSFVLFSVCLAAVTVALNVQLGSTIDAAVGNPIEVLNKVSGPKTQFNVTDDGQLPTNKSIQPSTNYIWNITSNISDTSTNALLLEKVHLADNDNLTVHLQGGNETVIFGPYHGFLEPLVIAVNLKAFTVKLNTSENKNGRVFHVLYNKRCIFAIPPTIDILKSPIYQENETVVNCVYNYNKIDENISYSFVFKNFSLDSFSNLEVTADDETAVNYKVTPPDIFGQVAKFSMTLNLNSSRNGFTIIRRDLVHQCSEFIELPNLRKPLLLTPPASKSPNLTTLECRWLIKTKNKGEILGLMVDTLQFGNVFDMLTINDGPSELSHPLVQASWISQNETRDKVIRTSGPYMWISFRSEDFASNFSGNYTQGQGGYYSGSGNISMSGSDAEFLLEVQEEEKVLLTFTSSDFASPASINIYDGFHTSSDLIAELSGSIWYPVVSGTSKMRVVASNFGGRKFTAEFRGLKSGCIHMSSSSNDAYVLSGNCNSTCMWTVPPRNISGVVQLGFQLIALNINDTVDVFRLGNSNASVARIVHGQKPVPPLTFDPKEGFLVNISRGECSRQDDIIIVAHSTYLPDCSGSFPLMPSGEVQLSSPDYPNMYPLRTRCQWNLTASGNTSQFYLSFISMNLAPNHCIEVRHSGKGNDTKTVFSGASLPDDMLFKNVTVSFDSFNCNKSGELTSLASGGGFVLNVTGSDCGGIMTAKTGNFSTTMATSKSSCFWIVRVPYKESDGSVNSIMFSVEKSGAQGTNSEFHVYDGPSVRDSPVTNLTSSIWSRNNTLVFVYKRFNSAGTSPLYNVTYKTINCNKTMQCENGICLHPDWLCDGVNNCGDFTDERNCETVPVPNPTKEASGISSVAFGLVTVLFFCLGALAAFLIPKAINRYRTGRYHQFQDYSGVD